MFNILQDITELIPITSFHNSYPEIRSSIYTSLAETVFCHWELNNRFGAKDNDKDEILYQDIYDNYQILNANYE